MSKKYIVLDRDGVINVDLFDYVLKNEDFQFENGSLEAILKLYENDYEIIIATNQKCINLNLITADGIKQINDFWIERSKKKVETYCMSECVLTKMKKTVIAENLKQVY